MRKLKGQFVAIVTHSEASRAREARRSPRAKKIWLRQSVATPAAPQGNQCEMLHFLASVHMGACNLILHIHVVVNIDSCQNRVSADQYHTTVCDRVYFKFAADRFLVFN